MNQLNGTITLAYLEEDNQQRVIFRVVPLCTKEGQLLSERATEFPDEGSLRVVPDKREQSTFKERMRMMGSFCAIQLIADGKELSKIRQNRNYNPDQGEKNQFAIYSDVISEFETEGLFEVVESAQSPVRTARVLLLRNKVLYGPVAAEELATVQEDALKPFGNDAFLLQTVELPDGSRHTLYWNPEAVTTWRQRRGTLRKKGAKPEDAEAVPESAQEPRKAEPETKKRAEAESKPAVERKRPAPRVKEPEVAPAVAVEPKPAPKPAVAKPIAPKPAAVLEEIEPIEATLPIGTKLDILDSNITFDEQLSQLEQPLSDGANRLGALVDRVQEGGAAAAFSGTPLIPTGARAPRRVKTEDPLHHVVDHQLREQSVGRESGFRPVDNPIENLTDALEAAWRADDTREQAIGMLCDNESFMRPFLKRMQRDARESCAVSAAQAQLDEMEAERLSMLVQLEQAKNDKRKAEEQLLAALSQKRRAELESLDRALEAKKAEAAQLDERLQALGDQAGQVAMQRFAESAETLIVNNNGGIVLSPVIGVTHALPEMVSAVRDMLFAAGFTYSEDETIELLLHFALSDELCLVAEHREDAARFALAALDALGLAGVTAQAFQGEAVAIASIVPMNGLRTPTVTVSPLDAPVLRMEGHKTLFVCGASEKELPLCPVIRPPALDARVREYKPVEPLRPTNLQSFDTLREEARSMPEEGERWFALLNDCLAEANCEVPQSLLNDMRLFVTLASARVGGGFVATADVANLHWLVPLWQRSCANAEPFRRAIVSLPKTMLALGIR